RPPFGASPKSACSTRAPFRRPSPQPRTLAPRQGAVKRDAAPQSRLGKQFDTSPPEHYVALEHTRTNRSVDMRTYYDIDLTGRSITRRELHGEDIVRAGRYLIAKTLLELGAATAAQLSPADPLICWAGPLAGPEFR